MQVSDPLFPQSPAAAILLPREIGFRLCQISLWILNLLSKLIYLPLKTRERAKYLTTVASTSTLDPISTHHPFLTQRTGD